MDKRIEPATVARDGAVVVVDQHESQHASKHESKHESKHASNHSGNPATRGRGVFGGACDAFARATRHAWDFSRGIVTLVFRVAYLLLTCVLTFSPGAFFENELTRSLHCVISMCMGATLFKRYWPFGGSYWNTKHMNSSCELDLQLTVERAHENTRIHVQTMLTECIFLMGAAALGSDQRRHLVCTWCVCLVTHAYALMIQRYNVILAERRMAALPPPGPTPEETMRANRRDISDLDDAVVQITNEPTDFRFLRDQGGWQLTIPYAKQSEYERDYCFGPVFETKREVTMFRTYVVQQISDSGRDPLDPFDVAQCLYLELFERWFQSFHEQYLSGETRAQKERRMRKWSHRWKRRKNALKNSD